MCNVISQCTWVHIMLQLYPQCVLSYFNHLKFAWACYEISSLYTWNVLWTCIGIIDLSTWSDIWPWITNSEQMAHIRAIPLCNIHVHLKLKSPRICNHLLGHCCTRITSVNIVVFFIVTPNICLSIKYPPIDKTNGKPQPCQLIQ
jgi:hypothetical protein